ncbi:MAG: translation initiation factor IF-2 [Candidatus Nanohaloarchaea archaeon]
MPRQPILSVLGHVDSGKTTLLDDIRESKITEGEAGGITQMIGATEVPIRTLKEVCGGLLNQLEADLTIPGLLFIDTPGHAAFSSLRKRGGSISDIAVVVVDVEEGIQPQTKEALEILQQTNTPFVVALNKIDKINGWRTEKELFTENLQLQQDHVKQQLDEKIYELMGELNEYDIVADRFDRVDNFQEKAAMIPISAKTGEGIPELLMVIAGLSQNYLGEKLEVHEGMGRGTVLEVSQEKGLGTTINVIHYDGVINKTDTLVYGTTEGAKTTDIRALLEPRPLQEIREDKQYNEADTVKPASGVKISGKDLEGVIAGAPIRTCTEEQIEEAKKEAEEELEAVEFETDKHGVVVKADSLGSLEALMRAVEEEDIKVQKAEVGPVKKGDVVDVQNEEVENQAIFAFNTGVTKQGETAVKDKGVKVFQSEVIYEIIDSYTEWREKLERERREKALSNTSRPAKIRLMPDHVFRSSNPAVVGVEVIEGVLSTGSSLMDEEGENIGRVKSIQEQNESVDEASKGDEVAVSITNATVGRNIEEGDILLSDITGEDYRKLQKLEDLTSAGEKEILEEIVELKDRKNPQWKLS